MKALLVIAFCLVAVSAHAQVVPRPGMGGRPIHVRSIAEQVAGAECVGAEVEGSSFAETMNPSGEPVGGGFGYSDIIRTGDYIITSSTTPQQFKTIVEGASSGEVVYVEEDVELNLTGIQVTVPQGVTLASNRGDCSTGSLGALLYSNGYYSNDPSYTLLMRSNSRLTGLRLRGPQSSNNDWGDTYPRAAAVWVGDIGQNNAPNVEIDNNEIYFWTRFGVQIVDSYQTRVHHNTLYHIRQDGFGNGIWVTGGSRGTIDPEDYPLLEGNLLEHNRHDIGSGGGGVGNAGWIARHNIIYHEQQANQKVDRHSGGGDHSEVNTNIFFGANPSAEDFGGFGSNDPGVYIFSNNYSDFSSLSGACPVCTAIGATTTDNTFGGQHRSLVPQAQVTASPTVGASPLTVTFDASGSTDPDDHPINAVRWNVHDTTYTWSMGTELEKTYTEVGTHHMTAYVRNRLGIFSRPVSTAVSVNNTGSPYLDFLTAYYSFDSTTEDEHATNDLSPSGGVSYTPGVQGNALAMGGSSYATATWESDAFWDVQMRSSDMAFSFWIDVNQMPESYAGVLGNGATGNADEGYLVAIRSTGAVVFGISDGQSRTLCTLGNAISASAGWQHVVINVDRSGSATAYVNGSSVGSCSISSRQDEILSLWNWSVGLNYVARANANLDELAIWHRTLTTNEIQFLYNSGSGRSYSSISQDNEAPSIPQNLTATAVGSSRIDLEWDASTDNVGVDHYVIRRGGSVIDSVVHGTTYSDIGLSASTTYTYTVSAVDAAGNESDESAPASATTSAEGTFALYTGPRTSLFAYYDGEGTNNDAYWVGPDGGHHVLRTAGGGPSTTTGIIGDAWLWTATEESNSSRLVFFEGAPIRFSGGDRSMGIWVRPDDISSDRGVLGKWDATNAAAREFRLYYSNAENRFRAQVLTSSGVQTLTASSAGPVSLGAWYFIQVSYTASAGEWKICVNRVCDTYTDIGSPQHASVFRTMDVGTDYVSYWRGAIDEIFVHHTVLPDSSSDLIYNSGSGRSLATWAGPKLPALDGPSQIMYSYMSEATAQDLAVEGNLEVSFSTASGESLVKAYLATVDDANAPFTGVKPGSRPASAYMLDDGAGGGIVGSDTIRIPDVSYAVAGEARGMTASPLLGLTGDGIVNGYYRHAGECRRQLHKQFTVLMMADYIRKVVGSNDLYGMGRIDMLGGWLVGAGQTMDMCLGIAPDTVKDAAIDKFVQLVQYMTASGPTDINTNMDAKAMEAGGFLVSLTREHRPSREQEIKDEVELLLRRFLFGYTDGSLSKWDLDRATWSPSGMPLEDDGATGTYGGRWIAHVASAKAAIGDDPQFAFLDTVLVRTANLMAAWNVFDDDGTIWGDAATGNRIPGKFGIDFQRWLIWPRTVMAAYYCTPDVNYVGCRVGLRHNGSSSISLPSESAMRANITAQLTDLSDTSPGSYTAPNFRDWEPWPQVGHYYPSGTGWYTNMAAAISAGDHRTYHYNHAQGGVGDTLVVFGPDSDPDGHSVFKWRRATDSEGNRFSYMIEAFTSPERDESYGGWAGGKIGVMYIEGYGGVIASDRADYTPHDEAGWPEAAALEQPYIEAADGSIHHFANEDRILRGVFSQSITSSTVSIGWEYDGLVEGDVVGFTKTYTDLEDGVEVQVDFDFDRDGDSSTFDATGVSYRLPFIDQNVVISYYDGSTTWKPLSSTYESATWLRVTRGSESAYIELVSGPIMVRKTSSTWASKYQAVLLSVHPDPGTNWTVQDTSLTFRVLTKAADPGFPDPPPLLANEVGSPYVAFSFRRLSNLYAGPAARLRRSGDGADADVCFDENDRVSGSSPVDTDFDGLCDDGTLSEWVGAGTLSLRRWYDQSGNGRNLTSVTGTIDVTTNENGWYFAETDLGERILNANTGPYAPPLAFVLSVQVTETGSYVFALNFGGLRDLSGSWSLRAAGNNAFSGGTVSANHDIVIGQVNGSSSTLHLNGTQVGSGSLESTSWSSGTALVLSGDKEGPKAAARFFDAIIFAGVLDADDRAAIQAHQDDYASPAP